MVRYDPEMLVDKLLERVQKHWQKKITRRSQVVEVGASGETVNVIDFHPRYCGLAFICIESMRSFML